MSHVKSPRQELLLDNTVIVDSTNIESLIIDRHIEKIYVETFKHPEKGVVSRICINLQDGISHVHLHAGEGWSMSAALVNHIRYRAQVVRVIVNNDLSRGRCKLMLIGTKDHKILEVMAVRNREATSHSDSGLWATEVTP